jgi:hypothetical protein
VAEMFPAIFFQRCRCKKYNFFFFFFKLEISFVNKNGVVAKSHFGCNHTLLSRSVVNLSKRQLSNGNFEKLYNILHVNYLDNEHLH